MIDYRAQRRVLVVTGGHAFERGPFVEMLASVPGTAWTHVEQPAAPGLFDVERAAPFAAILCYDMPGLAFTPGSRGGATGVEFVAPPPCLRVGLEALLEAGKPLIFMHHALAGWPAWPRYAQIMGGRFDYVRRPENGERDSGYLHGVRHTLRVAGEHPITAGIGAPFEIEDELYLVDIDESDKIPLLRSEFDFDPARFHSAHEAVCHDRLFAHHAWTRPRGSNLAAWLRREGNSPIVYVQCGDGPAAYANPGLRRLLANAVHWITSEEARHWARRAG